MIITYQIVLHNHEGEGLTPDKLGHDIKAITQELNIYESIYKSAVTGSIVINDATNIIGTLPIQGTETLSFKLSTPNPDMQSGILDASQKTGHPFHIYKLADKQQLSEGMCSCSHYTLVVVSSCVTQEFE